MRLTLSPTKITVLVLTGLAFSAPLYAQAPTSQAAPAPAPEAALAAPAAAAPDAVPPAPTPSRVDAIDAGSRTVRVGESVQLGMDFPIGDVASGAGQRYFRIAEPETGEEDPDLYELVLFGYAAGRDSLVVYDTEGVARRRLTIIVVEPSSIDKCAEDVQAMLADIPQVRVEALNTRVLVDGLALTPDIRERARAIVDSFTERGDCPVLALLEKSALYEREVERAVNDELQAMGIYTLRASLRNHKLTLSGAVTTDVEAELATKLARSYYEPLVNLVVIKPPMSLQEAAWEVRRALKASGYDLFVFARDKRIYVEGVAADAGAEADIAEIARANAGPHGGKVIIRVMAQ